MIPRPAMPSDPPPPRLAGRPMSVAMAVGWAAVAMLLFTVLRQLMVALRSAAQYDIVNAGGCQVVAYLLTIFFILRVHAPEASIRDFLALRRTHIAFYPLGLLLGLAIHLPATALYDVIEKRYPSPEPDQLATLFAEASSGRKIAIALVLVALGPVLEEVFFRGALFRTLRARYAAGLVVVVTGALFAAAHLPEWQTLAPIFVVGCALGLLRAMSGSIVPSALAHVGFNGLAIVGLVRDKTGANGGEIVVPRSVIAIATAVTFATVALAVLVALRSTAAARARDRDVR